MSEPTADLWGDDGVFARFTRAAQGINEIAQQCRDVAARHALSHRDAALIEAKAYLRGVEAALDRGRGTNADMCSSASSAHRLMCEALNKLRHEAERKVHDTATTLRTPPQQRNSD